MKAALDCQTNSPCQPLWKCLEDIMENMHTYVRVKCGRDLTVSLYYR